METGSPRTPHALAGAMARLLLPEVVARGRLCLCATWASVIAVPSRRCRSTRHKSNTAISDGLQLTRNTGRPHPHPPANRGKANGQLTRCRGEAPVVLPRRRHDAVLMAPSLQATSRKGSSICRRPRKSILSKKQTLKGHDSPGESAGGGKETARAEDNRGGHGRQWGDDGRKDGVEADVPGHAGGALRPTKDAATRRG